MARTSEDIEKQLDENIPRDVIAKRDGGGGKKLSYLETYYVIDRMNKVFGPLAWSMETVEMKLMEGTQKPTYVARVRVAVHLADGRLVTKDGTGYGSDKSTMNPHEMAVKEAESDAFKRAAMKFGISMGLGLYEKTGEYIDDGESGSPESARPAAQSAPRAKPQAKAPEKSSVANEVPAVAGQEEPREKVNELITQLSKVVIARKLQNVTEIKEYLKTKYGVEKKEELSNEQAAELVTYLKGVLA